MVNLNLTAFKERNKADGIGREGIAVEVARKTSQPKARIRNIVDEVFLTLQEALEAGKRVEIRGFGSLVPHRRNPRRSFVPTKKGIVKVEARWVIQFKTSKDLKKSLMENLEG